MVKNRKNVRTANKDNSMRRRLIRMDNTLIDSSKAEESVGTSHDESEY